MLHRLLVATALLASTLEGQARPIAGLNPKLLRLGTDSLEVFIMRQGKQGRSGTIVDALDTVRVNGELLLQRVYSRTDAVLGDGAPSLT